MTQATVQPACTLRVFRISDAIRNETGANDDEARIDTHQDVEDLQAPVGAGESLYFEAEFATTGDPDMNLALIVKTPPHPNGGFQIIGRSRSGRWRGKNYGADAFNAPVGILRSEIPGELQGYGTFQVRGVLHNGEQQGLLKFQFGIVPPCTVGEAVFLTTAAFGTPDLLDAEQEGSPGGSVFHVDTIHIGPTPEGQGAIFCGIFIENLASGGQPAQVTSIFSEDPEINFTEIIGIAATETGQAPNGRDAFFSFYANIDGIFDGDISIRNNNAGMLVVAAFVPHTGDGIVINEQHPELNNQYLVIDANDFSVTLPEEPDEDSTMLAWAWSVGGNTGDHPAPTITSTSDGWEQIGGHAVGQLTNPATRPRKLILLTRRGGTGSDTASIHFESSGNGEEDGAIWMHEVNCCDECGLGEER